MANPTFNQDESGRAEVVPMVMLPTLEFDAGGDATRGAGAAIPMTILPTLESELTRSSDTTSSNTQSVTNGLIVSVQPPAGQPLDPHDMADLSGVLDTLRQKGYRVEKQIARTP